MEEIQTCVTDSCHHSLGVATCGDFPRTSQSGDFAVVSYAGENVALSGKPDNWPAEIRALLGNGSILKTGSRLKQLGVFLARSGVELRGPFCDIHVAEQLLDAAAGPGSEESSLEKRAEQALADAIELRQLLSEKKLDFVFNQIEMPIIPVLVDMEVEGIRVDPEILRAQKSSIATLADEVLSSICNFAKRPVNMDSLADVGKLLFEELQITPDPPRTRTNQYATNADTLRGLLHSHPIVPRILEHRQLKTLERTYLDKLPGAVNPTTGRIHTHFQSAETATGRISTTDPNLQNLPSRNDLGQNIRRAFQARNDDYTLLWADYSQIEMRILATMSGEPNLIRAFHEKTDIHEQMAALINGVNTDRVTPKMRAAAKVVNYGVSYGMSSVGLAQRLGIDRGKAQDLIDGYFTRFPGLCRYNSQTIKAAEADGFVTTGTGRRVYLPDLKSRRFQERQAAKRAAVAAPIQGYAADMIKLAMVAIHRELISRRLKTRMLLQIHDELVFDVLKSELDEVRALVEEQMTTALRLSVPVEVNIGTGANLLGEPS